MNLFVYILGIWYGSSSFIHTAGGTKPSTSESFKTAQIFPVSSTYQSLDFQVRGGGGDWVRKDKFNVNYSANIKPTEKKTEKIRNAVTVNVPWPNTFSSLMNPDQKVILIG